METVLILQYYLEDDGTENEVLSHAVLKAKS